MTRTRLSALQPPPPLPLITKQMLILVLIISFVVTASVIIRPTNDDDDRRRPTNGRSIHFYVAADHSHAVDVRMVGQNHHHFRSRPRLCHHYLTNKVPSTATVGISSSLLFSSSSSSSSSTERSPSIPTSKISSSTRHMVDSIRGGEFENPTQDQHRQNQQQRRHEMQSPSPAPSLSPPVQTSRGTMADARLQRGGRPKHSPVIYQYFGSTRKSHNHHQVSSSSSQSSSSSSSSSPSSSSSSSSSSSTTATSTGDDTIHFIILGRRVERFKNVGKMLANRGFDAMVCERVQQHVNQQQSQNVHSNNSNNIWGASTKNAHDAPDLVLEILDALKWDKVVLVGCDDECVLAMETAMMLAPDQVVGLILCGDITEANRCAVEWGGIELDNFLHRVLDCPFVIVWDGRQSTLPGGPDSTTMVDIDESLTIDMSERALILGGGDAPYQSKPEQFAWVLTRFVEEKLEFVPVRPVIAGPTGSADLSSTDSQNFRRSDGGASTSSTGGRGNFLQNLNLPFGINSLVSPEGRLLLGRAVAAALFYTSVMKVFLVQYGALRYGVISIKNSVDSVDALRRNIFHAVGLFVVNFGYIPRLFRVRVRKAKEPDDNDLEPTGSESQLHDSGDGEGDGGGSASDTNVKKLDANIGDEEIAPGGSSQTVEDEVDSRGTGSNVETPSTSEESSESISDDNGRPTDEQSGESDRPNFKPFFFLDNVIT